MCNYLTCSKSGISPNGLIYTIGFFVPFLAINLSYCIIANIATSQAEKGTDKTRAAVQRNLRITITLVCASYALLCGPLLFVQWILKFNVDDKTMVAVNTFGFAWYRWIYAINVIVYTRNQEFRAMYKRLWDDMRSNIKARMEKMSNANGENNFYSMNVFRYVQ
eukprot:TRINITY_DN14482_c0_g1_i2.p1 TRINITY_DN14482_c0_g1~~TRINITY_DN14482_c0_g1_i2.p1  ORF type:complete len:164 (-),score=24.04 TRINITY_DN14482_c0_g1_i2:56-547(-)